MNARICSLDVQPGDHAGAQVVGRILGQLHRVAAVGVHDPDVTDLRVVDGR